MAQNNLKDFYVKIRSLNINIHFLPWRPIVSYRSVNTIISRQVCNRDITILITSRERIHIVSMRWGAVHLLMSSWVCRIDSMALWISLRSVPFFLRRLLCLLLCPGWKIRWVFGVLLVCLCACLTYSRCLKSPGGPAPETSSHFLDFYVCHSYVSALVPSPNQTHTPTRAGLSHVSVVMLWLRVWSVFVIHRYS